MDELQDRLVRVGLNILGEYGFVLAGGYAVQAHQLVDRMSEDVDLFTDRWDSNEFGLAVEAVSEAYRKDGLEITVIRRADTFARLSVLDPRSGKVGSVDLAADFRHSDPVKLSEGPVLAERDAVASIVATVFSRGEARDYLGLTGMLQSERFSREELMDLAANVVAGFSQSWFARYRRGLDRYGFEVASRNALSSRIAAPTRLVPVENRQHAKVLRPSCGFLRADHVVQVRNGDLDSLDDYAMGVHSQLRVAAVEAGRTE